jgi:uncharacterized membrane-anchored protein YitT (DUF2179 family)
MIFIIFHSEFKGAVLMKNFIWDFCYNTFLLIIGSFICAVAVNGMLIPHGFISSGMTGAALIIYYKHPVMSVGIIYLLISIPIFFLGWFFISLRFVLYTMWGMLIYSVMLYLIDVQIYFNDNMLSAVVAGTITGIGVAIVLRSYGSGGGSEIVCVILNRFFSITIGTGAIIINSIILLVSAYYFPVDKVLYTFIYIAVSSEVTDRVFHGLVKRKAALIISEKWEEIVDAMTTVHKIGVTLINGQGGYRGTDRTILYSVFNRKALPVLKKTVLETDPAAFIAVMEASDVVGVDVGNQPHW